MADPKENTVSGRSCTCPHEVRGLGRLHGFDMGRGTVRVSTTKDCPEHDSCHRWTAERRADNSAACPWSDPYCPIHKTANCPEEKS